MQKIQYQASRTGAKFHASDAFVRGIMGPVGSGKSVMCVTEILKRAYQQKADANGRRRSRWAVVRNTYPELKATTIKTWSDWVPESICPIVYGAPITGHMETRLKDGTILDLEVLFLALDKMKDQKKLLSLELTGAWFNEVREIPKPIVDAMLSRVGRFPSKRDGGSKWIGVIMDTNPPDDLHWYYHLAEEDTPAGWEFFRQPGGLIRNGDQYSINPDAENLEHLEGGRRLLHETGIRHAAGLHQRHALRRIRIAVRRQTCLQRGMERADSCFPRTSGISAEPAAAARLGLRADTGVYRRSGNGKRAAPHSE